MVYTATAEAVAGHLVRVHPCDHPVAGVSPYDASCVAETDWGRLWWRWWAGRGPVAVVKGFVVRGGTFRDHAAVIRAVEDRLRDLGYARMRYDRVKPDGRTVRHEKEL